MTDPDPDTAKRLWHLERDLAIRFAVITRKLSGATAIDFLLWEADRKSDIDPRLA